MINIETIVAARDAINKVKEVILAGFLKSLQSALGLFIHKGPKSMAKLPSIKGITDKVTKSISPITNPIRPANNVI